MSKGETNKKILWKTAKSRSLIQFAFFFVLETKNVKSILNDYIMCSASVKCSPAIFHSTSFYMNFFFIFYCRKVLSVNYGVSSCKMIFFYFQWQYLCYVLMLNSRMMIADLKTSAFSWPVNSLWLLCSCTRLRLLFYTQSPYFLKISYLISEKSS